MRAIFGWGERCCRPVASFEVCDELWQRFERRSLVDCVPFHSPDGVFTVERDPDPRRVAYLAVSSEGYRTAYAGYRGRGGDGLDLGDLRLAASRKTLAVVVDGAGSPVAGAQIFLVAPNGEQRREWVATTEVHGEARFWSRDGRHCLVAEHPLYEPSSSRACMFRLVEGSPWHVTLALGPARLRAACP